MPRTLEDITSAAPEELKALASSVRAVIERMLVIDTAHDDLVWAKQQLDEVADRLARHGRTSLTPRLGRKGETADARPYTMRSVFMPEHNPIAPLVDTRFEDGVLRGTVTLGVAYEGPPSCVHGGIVASLLDQILGQANLSGGVPAMTGTLKIRYLAPTPLFTELRFEARTESVEDRKVVTEGRILAGDRVTAEAEGLFVLLEPKHELRKKFHRADDA